MEARVIQSLDTLQAFAGHNALEITDPALLRTALTHRSYLNEHPDLDWEDNERLEFLGDAVLDFLLAEHLFLAFPNAAEGELTALRAALVRRDTLAGFAQTLGIGPALLMGQGEADTGGRGRPATLCATFEALVGALYLDQGMAAVAQWVMPMMEGKLPAAQAEAGKDPKSQLQELAQGAVGLTPRYRTTKSAGPDHAKTFTVEVTIGDAICGVGAGPSKQLAARQAALDALRQAHAWIPAASDANWQVEGEREWD